MIPPRKAIYVLPGEPECVSHQRFQMNKVHETQRQQKVMHEITLTSQHNDDPPFDAPLHIDIKFYVDPGQKKQAQQADNSVHQQGRNRLCPGQVHPR